jgi:3-oxoacyl-[acyl-carrier protein] reductase
MTADSTSLPHVVLITGGSRGIGAATAIEFARRRPVAVLGRSTTFAIACARYVRCDQAAAAAIALRADVRDEAEVRAAVERPLTELGRIDVLVNNAAYFHASPFHQTPLARWDLTVDVNLRGAAVCTQAVLPAMMAQRSGRIINISSGAAVGYFEGMSAYAASKAGLETLTRYLAAEQAPHGIAANTLRIDSAVATEGARFLNPDGDYSGWTTAQEAAQVALWVAAQPLSFSGRVVVMSNVDVS